MIPVRYCAPVFDGSGYAKAARGNIMALHKLGVPISVNPMSFESIKPNLNKEGKIIKSLVNKEIKYKVNIMHCTPEFYEKLKNPGIINLGMTIWETTKLHPDWAGYINNNTDGVIVGCPWNVEIFKASGVTVPIYVAEHGIEKNIHKNIKPMNITNLNDSAYKFYFIGQFTERKNPIDLIKAYLHAFDKGENVALIMKTYRSDYSETEKEAVRVTIKRLKFIMPMENYPPIYLILHMLSENEIRSLHALGDCYISLDRGEGWGLSSFEAGAHGNPLIVTGFSGTTTYAKPDNSYLVDYTLTPVSGMTWCPWYRGDQLWASPDVEHAANRMRYVYENREEAFNKGKKLQSYIYDNFTWIDIGKKLVKIMEDASSRRKKN